MSKSDITVYGRATSSNVQAVMWGLAELDLPCKRLDYGHKFGGTGSPEFKAMTPHGVVPVLKDGDLVIWESCAILRYLASKYGDAPFWPKDPDERASVDMWAEWGKTSFCSKLTQPIFWLRVRTAQKDRDEAALANGIAYFETQLDILESQLSKHDYVTGDALTLADIVISHVLFRWFEMDITRQPRPVVEAYYARLCQRDAFRENVMVSYEDLTVPGA